MSTFELAVIYCTYEFVSASLAYSSDRQPTAADSDN